MLTACLNTIPFETFPFYCLLNFFFFHLYHNFCFFSFFWVFFFFYLDGNATHYRFQVNISSTKCFTDDLPFFGWGVVGGGGVSPRCVIDTRTDKGMDHSKKWERDIGANKEERNNGAMEERRCACGRNHNGGANIVLF